VKIGIYSSNFREHLDSNLSNQLIVNYIFGELGAESLLAFRHKKENHSTFLKSKAIPVIIPGGIRKLVEKSLVLPSLLKKNSTGALLLFDIEDVLPVKVPQFLLLSDAYQFQQKHRQFFKKLEGVITSSHKLKAQIIATSGINPEKVIVTEGLIQPAMEPPEYMDTLKFKGNLTEGREYFICADAHWTRERLVLLLKAFSRFKKMQHTGWKLILTQRGLDPARAFASAFEVLNTYKYRDDVVLFESAPEMPYAHALGGAYAAIAIDQTAGFSAAVWEAVRCGSTVLVPDHFDQNGLAALPTYLANDEESLGIKMMELYKNEGLRQQYLDSLRQKPAPPDAEPGLLLLKSRLLRS